MKENEGVCGSSGRMKLICYKKNWQLDKVVTKRSNFGPKYVKNRAQQVEPLIYSKTVLGSNPGLHVLSVHVGDLSRYPVQKDDLV